MFLKHQKGIINCRREYFYALLNPVTVQHLETFDKQIGEEIYLTEAEVATTIQIFESW